MAKKGEWNVVVWFIDGSSSSWKRLQTKPRETATQIVFGTTRVILANVKSYDVHCKKDE